MSRRTEFRESLLGVVPDTPVWIEARAALLDPQSQLFGDSDGYVIRSDRWRLAGIGRHASKDLIRQALSDIPTIAEAPADPATANAPLAKAVPEWAVVQPEGFSPSAMAALSRWTSTDADIFGEPSAGIGRWDLDCGARLGLFEPEDGAIFDSLPDPLTSELRDALERVEVAAAWVDDLPVSFCYAACETDSLWELSISTLPGFRRRGWAAAVVAFMAHRMRERGKRAAWGAHSHNQASRRLARKLGFEPAGRLFLFENGLAAPDE